VLKWKGKLPGIVMVNGHGSDKFGWYAMYTGMEYAKAGAMVVTYDMIGEGERNIDKKSRASSHDKRVTPPDGVPATDWGQRVAGLMQVDLMQGVSYLIAQPEVDAKRIAVMGYSMGSFVTGIAGATDTRIHAIVLSGGGVFDGPGGYFDSGPLPCQGPPYRALQVIGDRSAILYALNAERGPMYIMNGAVDTVMDIPHHLQPWFDEVRTRAIAVRGTDKDMFTTVFYPGVSHRPSWENRDAALWLNRNIHFAIWTDKEIEALPTIKASEWAKQAGATVSAGDMREDHEGGIDALNVGLPNIKREDLMVLPEADWTVMKDQLIYEAWAAKMNAAELAMAQKAEIRKSLYIPAKLPELNAKRWSTFSPTAGVLADRVTYATADGMMVPAIVYRPDPGALTAAKRQAIRSMPGIVVVNGHGSDKFGWYAFYSGMLFANLGAVVVTYDMIGEGERNAEKRSKAGAHDAWIASTGSVAGEDAGRRLAGLMQVDLMQAVSYLAAQPEVDAGRIAVVGYSTGAFVAGITGAIDDRIHAIVLSGGGVYDEVGPGYFEKNALPCQGPPMRALRGLGDRAPILFALNARRGPMLVMNGDDDTVMDMAHHPPEWFAAVRARAIALAGTDTNMFTTIVYPGISHRTSWVNKDGVLWLESQIHFALSSEQEIAAAPVTHVSTWARANDVDIAPNYIVENREGGLDAVGTGLPGIKREDLMVLPEADWVVQKDRLTYEAWAEKIKTAEATLTGTSSGD
jgi:dienelactone hydrolase